MTFFTMNKKNSFLVVTLLCLMLVLSSCFEIIEEITIYPDGKGKAGLTINLSQGKTKLASIMLMDSIRGNRVPSQEEIINEIDKAKEIAKATPGINNVLTKVDFNNFIFEMSCDFDSVECLNHFVNRLENNYTEHQVSMKQLYSYNNNTYIRNADYLVPNKHKKAIAQEKGSLLTAKYISIVRLPYEVQEMSNKKAKLAKNKKAIMLKINGDKLLENTSSVTNKVIIKQP